MYSLMSNRWKSIPITFASWRATRALPERHRNEILLEVSQPLLVARRHLAWWDLRHARENALDVDYLDHRGLGRHVAGSGQGVIQARGHVPGPCFGLLARDLGRIKPWLVSLKAELLR